MELSPVYCRRRVVPGRDGRLSWFRAVAFTAGDHLDPATFRGMPRRPSATRAVLADCRSRRSDSMNEHRRFSLGRRQILAAGIGAAALVLPQAPAHAVRLIYLRGMSGGGLAQLEGSEEPRL